MKLLKSAEVKKMSENQKPHRGDCECNLPNVRDSFQDGKCSKEQVCKCHGDVMYEKWKAEGKVE